MINLETHAIGSGHLLCFYFVNLFLESRAFIFLLCYPHSRQWYEANSMNELTLGFYICSLDLNEKSPAAVVMLAQVYIRSRFSSQCALLYPPVITVVLSVFFYYMLFTCLSQCAHSYGKSLSRLIASILWFEIKVLNCLSHGLTLI